MTKKEIILIFILLIIGLIRFFYIIPGKPEYDGVVGGEVSFEGVVVDMPDIRIFNQRIVVRPTNQKSNILVIIPKEIDISYGDKVIARGVLESPLNFITNAGKEFNYKRYLANQDIYFIINNAEVEVISHNNGSWIKSKLFWLRGKFMENISRVIFSPEKDLANGLLLGTRGGFDNEMKNEFITTGTIHIIALSGYNISIISENVMKFFLFFFSQTISIILGIFVIILFIIMTGGAETSIRAGIMGIIMLFGRMTGRTYEAGRALLIVALMMIAYDLRVVSDISFQLSFLATAGVLFITPKIIGWFKIFPIRFKIRENIVTTISASISVLPVLLYSTGVFSIVSLPANVFILPIIPATMFFSFLSGIIGFISPFLSLPFAFIAQLLLSYILFVINFFASLPLASINIKSFPLVLTITIYGFLFWWIFRKK